MNGNKRINNLKRLVIIISIAILIVAVILIMSLYNNKFKGDWGASEGGKSTVSTTKFTDIIIDPDTGEEITNAPTTEPTTEETTAPTSAPTTSSTKVTRSSSKTQTPTSGSVVVTQPPAKYTIITSGGSGFTNANASLEWALVNEINSRRSNKLQAASELRSKAESSASNAVNTYDDSINHGYCQTANDPNCKCDFGGVKFDGAAYCVWYNREIAEVADRLIGENSGILDEDYRYIGVGVVLKNGNYSYVVIVD